MRVLGKMKRSKMKEMGFSFFHFFLLFDLNCTFYFLRCSCHTLYVTWCICSLVMTMVHLLVDWWVVYAHIYIYLHSLFSRPWFNPCRFVECLICWGSIFACVHHQQDPILLLLLQCTTAFFKHVLWKSTIKKMYSGGLRLTFNLKLLYVLVHPLCTQLVQLL
jgi:hypothetical protein